MTKNKSLGRKTGRIVRMPATKFGKLQKKLRQAPLRAPKLPKRQGGTP
jgi:hypothetical protein